jgi:hypothetical protein
VSKTPQNGSAQGAWTLPLDPHHEFESLCALSTTGELTAEEWARLTEHLAHCDACREAERQYEQVISTSMPALAVESLAEQEEESAPGSWSIEEAEARLMVSLQDEPAPVRAASVSSSSRFISMSISRWKPARRYAMAASILLACGFAGYRIGVLRERGTVAIHAPAISLVPSNPVRMNPPASFPAPSLAKKITLDDGQGGASRDQLRMSEVELAKLKGQLAQLEDELTKRSADLDRSIEARADLDRQLALAQANQQSLQTKLSQTSEQPPQGTPQSLELKTQVRDLTAALAEKDREIGEERELLQHDRDIRNLIGARNLYIAEIYDVAKSGDTQKPFGRVFYTKDKSLIFYGYDLDQQKGVRKASTFQAWGSHGADRQNAVSLGLLYQDDANQKRWVLKFKDAKTIAKIDAVFITVEPDGGSAKPTTKPLLFTYLRLDPNHP